MEVTVNPSRARANAGVRLHALDAVRAAALLLGIVLHATLSFFPPGAVTVWPVVDRASSHALGLAFYVIHSFRMLVFFLLAGFFARLLISRDGLRTFLGGRVRRVLLPFVAALIILVPATAASARIVPSGALEPGRLPPLMHLWFLYLLLWFYALIAAGVFSERVAPIALGRRLQALGDRIVGSAWLPFVAALPGAIALGSLPLWAAWFGVPTPDWLPNRAAVVCYGSAVMVGWWMQPRGDSLKALERRWPVYLLVAVLGTSACLSLVGIRPNYGLAAAGFGTAIYALLYTVAGWSWALTMIGVGLRTFAAPNRAIRFIADASYWAYLVHLPLILILQAMVASWHLHWAVKFLVVASVPMPLLFGTYYVFSVVYPRRHRLISLQRADA